MKIVFWLSTIVVLITNCFLLMGFINVYFKNYNGGPQSSSGSVYQPLLAGMVILIAGLICYFTGNIRWAAGIMGIPIILVLLYMFIRIILPVLLGGRMN